MHASYFTEADLETHVLAAGYNYAFRKNGMDVLALITLADLGLIRDALPVLDDFVRGTTVDFGADAV